MCRLPGAISACPGSTESLCSASLTEIWHNASRRRAKVAVNPSGMCWTITIPGQSRGSVSSTTRSDSVPPVEAPIQTTGSVGLTLARRLGGGRICLLYTSDAADEEDSVDL